MNEYFAIYAQTYIIIIYYIKPSLLWRDQFLQNNFFYSVYVYIGSDFDQCNIFWRQFHFEKVEACKYNIVICIFRICKYYISVCICGFFEIESW